MIQRLRFAALTLAALSATLSLSACGFTPIYAEHTGVGADLSMIRVDTGDGRSAYLLRQEVLDRLGSRDNEATAIYELNTSVRESRKGLGIRLDDVATRFEINMRVAYVLREVGDGSLVTRGQVVGTASYDVTNQPYTDIAVEERARERAASLAADKLRTELAFHFAQTNRN